MSLHLALLIGAVAGTVMGALLLPVTRHELAGAMARASGDISGSGPRLLRWHQVALVATSGVLPAILLDRIGWTIESLPPLLLLLGLVQLAYCDLTQFLLPKSMVHATTGSVAAAAVIAAGVSGDWHRFVVALAGGAALFLLLFAINLANPAWMAFGDVRLAPAVGLGLAWVSPLALFQGFFFANVLAAVVGLVLMLASRGSRKTALPFGFYLAVASAGVLFMAR